MNQRVNIGLGSESEETWERATARRAIDPLALDQMIEFWHPGAEIVRAEPISSGGRNTHFAITLQRAPCERIMLRIYADDDETYRKEAALHRHFAGAIALPKCFCAARERAIYPGPFAILEFLPGTLLSQHRGAAGLAPVFEELGEAAAWIHRRRYLAVGFLDGNLDLSEHLPPLAQWYEDFLGARAIERLGAELTGELRRYLLLNRPWIDLLDTRPTLVHGDFRPANLLVAEGRLRGILDWEFAMAGHAASDLGQLFRYDDGWPAELEGAFRSGYCRAGGTFDANWRTAARLRDVANLLHMLDRTAEMPNFYESIRRRIAATLAACRQGHHTGN